MNQFVAAILGLVLLPYFALAGRPTPNLDVLPTPQVFEQKADCFVLDAQARAFVSGQSDSASTAYENFCKLANLELQLSFPVIQRMDSLPPCQLLLTKDVGLTTGLPPVSGELARHGAEAYELIVTAQGVRVAANSTQGLFWGLITLTQLVTTSDSGSAIVPGVYVLDWPDYPWRGYMLDTGRAPFSSAQIKRVMRIGAMFKLNFLMLREGDDELNAFRYELLPLGHKNPYALSIDELRDLITYGESLGLRVFFEIESLGHAGAKRLFYPDVIEGGFPEEYWPGFVHIRKANFRVGDLRTYQILQSMYEELFPLLHFPVVHLGLDEVRLPQDLQSQHLARLLPLVDAVGKKCGKELEMVVWSDAPPTPAEWRERVIRCLWVYNDSVTTKHSGALRQGLTHLLEPGCRERVLMAGGSGTHHKPFSKDPYPAALRNLYSWAILGKEHPNFIGLLAVQWATNVVDQWLPNFLMAADFGWHVPGAMPKPDSGLSKIFRHLQNLRDYCEPLSEEMPRPAWDGIWLEGPYWDEDILTGQKAAPVLNFGDAWPYFEDISQPITLSTNHPEGKITYTLDGSEPTPTSQTYWKPFRVRRTTRVRARCFVAGRPPSYIVEKTLINLKRMPSLKPHGRLRPGLLYAYYQARVRYAESLARLKPTRIGVVEHVTFPPDANGVEHFGVVFKGYLKVPRSGVYTLYLRSNDGSRLYLDNFHLIDNDGLHGSREAWARVNLRGGFHSIRIEYFQAGGNRDLELLWQGPNFVKKPVPENAFFHTGYGSEFLKD